MGAKMFRPFIVLTPQPTNGQNVLHYLSLSGGFVLLHYPGTFMSLEKLDECLPTIRKLTLKTFEKCEKHIISLVPIQILQHKWRMAPTKGNKRRSFTRGSDSF